MISEEKEGQNMLEAFDIYKNRAIDYLVNQYPKEIVEYEDVFTKPIWVTEWNLQMSKTTGNTLLQSLFVAQYILELLSNPDLSSIELTTYHNLGGRDLSGSIFGYSKEEIEIHSTYYPFMLIGKIFENDIVSVEKENKDEVFSYRCYNNNEVKVLEYIVDWSNNKFYCIYDINSFSSSCISYGSNYLNDIANKNGILNLDKTITID